MTARATFLDPAIADYIASIAVREAPVLAKLRAETARLPTAQMQIGADQGQFMQLLARMLGAKKYLEIGVFTGYSSLAMALALPDDGMVLACDVSDEYTAIARRYWKEAEVEKKIDLRLAPAVETLERLLDAGQASTFDLAFIDADKANVDTYYESALRLLHAGGLILVDNVLWNGAVADARINDDDTRALRALNIKATSDDRVDMSLLTVGDGLLVARKR